MFTHLHFLKYNQYLNNSMAFVISFFINLPHEMFLKNIFLFYLRINNIIFVIRFIFNSVPFFFRDGHLGYFL